MAEQPQILAQNAASRQVQGVVIDQLLIVLASAYKRLDAGVCLEVGMRLPAGWGVGVHAYGGATALAIDPHAYQYAAGVMPTAGSQYRRTLQASLTYRLLGEKVALV